MRLFFDIGNTRLKWATDEGDHGRAFKEVGTVSYKEEDWTALELIKCDSIESVWISSVASVDVNSQIDGWVNERFGVSPMWLEVEQSKCGINNGYGVLSQLGVDRWAAILGANHYLINNDLEDASAIVVDAGTAVTIDALIRGQSGVAFQGGVILPGLMMMHDALVGKTQGIASSLESDLVLPGVNTQQCVNSGIHYGLCGGVERVVGELQEALMVDDSRLFVMVTGGDASLIERYSSLEVIGLPNLVIDGLRAVAQTSESK